MNTTQAIGFAGRAGAAFAAYRYLGPKMPGGPVVAALVGWLVADLVLDRVLPG